MKISYEWLREYVNTKLRAENIASKLTMAGHEVSAITRQDNDFIFDMEITPNRADCLSHLGIAREVAAITGKELKVPHVKIRKAISGKKPFNVSIESKPACPRYTCRVINNVKVAPSPKWLVKRIESMGLRTVNNIVDITNFVLFETGQPLHAFDSDKFSGQEIIVRNAKHKECITTIDGVERKLYSGMLVIADRERPMAIAGIMGGKQAEVTEKTENIFLESAYFNAVSVRRAALNLGLSTDSSYRFERGVDLGGILFASDRATSLICGIAKGTPRAIKDVGAKTAPSAKIILRPAYLNKILGTGLKAAEISNILSRLGFSVKGTSSLIVTAPAYRSDTTREADLTEEVARIYGYENIAPSPLKVVTTTEDSQAKDFMKKRDITKNMLVASGFNEIITYSLVSGDTIKNTAFLSEDFVVIKNPLSREQNIMRPSLLPGMLKAVAYNLSRQAYNIKLFELSNIYFQKKAEYNEEPSLALAQYDRPGKELQKDYSETGLFQLKGALSGLGKRLGITGLAFEKISHPVFDKGEAAAVLADNIMLGIIGRVNEETLHSFDISGRLFIVELNFNMLAASSNLKRYYKPLPRFPYSYRDVSFSIDPSVPYSELTTFFRQTGGAQLEKVKLLSEYRGEQIERGRRALAIRMIFRSKEKTLTEEEIDVADTAIREGLKEKFNAILR
jgi:phenylalanyl-tRNA synthetase beta chain